MSLLEYAHRGENLADDASDGRLSSSRISGKDHVQADGRFAQPGFAAAAFKLEIIGKRANFLFDRGKSDQLV